MSNVNHKSKVQTIRNLSAILESAGSSQQDVVKVNVFITTMNDFDAMNKEYLQFFKQPLPVCSFKLHRYTE